MAGFRCFGAYLCYPHGMMEYWEGATPLSSSSDRMLAGFPGANMKEFWLTILSEAKQIMLNSKNQAI